MTVTERLMLPGAWSLTLSPDTPQSILDVLDLADAAFGHVIVTPTHLQASEVSGATLLSVARYTGILRSRLSKYEMGGTGLPAWLGDEDGKGDPIEWGLAKVSGSFGDWVGDIRPASLSAGTVTAIAGALTQTFRFISRREAINAVCDYFGGEWRVNPGGTLDAGAESDLFTTVPTVVVQRRSGGRDINVTGVYGDLDVSTDVDDYTTRVILLGDNKVGAASISPAPTWLDLNGNVVEWQRIIESTETARGNENTVAQAQLNRFTKSRKAVTLSSDQFDIGADFDVGDTINVWDPEQGLVDTSNPVQYRGQTIYPLQIRVLGYTWPVQSGMGVYFRAPDASGTITDLTDYVEWETANTQIEIGATPRRTTDEDSVASASSVAQPRARVIATRSSNQNISHSSTNWQTCVIDEQRDDTDDFASNTFTAPVAGFYDFSGGFLWAANATGRRGIRFLVNGTGTGEGTKITNALSTGGNAMGTTVLDLELNAGDTVVMQAFQDSGGSLALNNSVIPARFTARESR